MKKKRRSSQITRMGRNGFVDLLGTYPLVNQDSNGISLFLIGNYIEITSSIRVHFALPWLPRCTSLLYHVISLFGPPERNARRPEPCFGSMMKRNVYFNTWMFPWPGDPTGVGLMVGSNISVGVFRELQMMLFLLRPQATAW